MLSAILWGLVQGLTEFLPISSSGHLVLVPAFLGALGVDLEEPSLAFSAVLHLGTLLAVLWYFRSDIARLLRFRTDPIARRIALLIVIGTIPAVVGLPLRPLLEDIQSDPTQVGLALIGTSIILLVGSRFMGGTRSLDQARPVDGVIVGIAQAAALVPGISRSGATIVAGSILGLTPPEAARYSFLLGIPAIAGAGVISLLELPVGEAISYPTLMGVIVAAVSGYGAIAVLLAALRRTGLLPFAVYALVVGLAAVIWL